MSENVKLMIAIPTLDYIHWRFAECLSKLTARLTKIGIEHEVRFKGGTLVYFGREDLAKDAIADGFTHMLWLDADMIFPETAYEQLAKTEADIVSAVYIGRHGKRQSTIFSSLTPPERIKTFEKDKIIPIKGCGFGCALTTTRILNRVLMEYDRMFGPLPQFGEDLSFCFRAGEMDATMYADTGVECGHIGQGIIWPGKEPEWI